MIPALTETAKIRSALGKQIVNEQFLKCGTIFLLRLYSL
jgi:hypothetical protein